MEPKRAGRPRRTASAAPPEPERGYHHGNLRRALLDAALALFAERGTFDFTFRELSRAADVTHNAPYRHFQGKEDLLHALRAEGLARLATEGLSGTLDMAFVDADKTGYPDYYEKVLGLLRQGGLALFDNVLWSGRVADPSDTDPDTVALRKVAEIAKADPRVEAAMIAVGDGVLMVRKR